MNSFATASASAPLYMTAGRKQQMPAYDYLAPAAGYTPWATPAVQYDTRGRLQPFVETSEQRRARAEFLRKREFSRRIHAWIQGSESSGSAPASSKSADTDSLRTIDEDDEAEEGEREVIYATSPAQPWALAAPASTRQPSRHLRASSRTSSMSSLSSISEEESV